MVSALDFDGNGHARLLGTHTGRRRQRCGPVMVTSCKLYLLETTCQELPGMLFPIGTVCTKSPSHSDTPGLCESYDVHFFIPLQGVCASYQECRNMLEPPRRAFGWIQRSDGWEGWAEVNRILVRSLRGSREAFMLKHDAIRLSGWMEATWGNAPRCSER